MTIEEESRAARVQGDDAQEEAGLPALGDLLSGLLGADASGSGGVEAALQGLFNQSGAAGQSDEDDGVSAELLSALAKNQGSAITGSASDILERAVEALGLPPALVEKLLPTILSRLPALTQGSSQATPSVTTRKRATKEGQTPAKTRRKSTQPAASGKSKRSKSSEAAKSPSASGSRKRSSGSSGTASKRSSGGSSTKRSKRSADTDGIGLDDIFKELIR